MASLTTAQAVSVANFFDGDHAVVYSNYPRIDDLLFMPGLWLHPGQAISNSGYR
jgi:hypothetical protein